MPSKNCAIDFNFSFENSFGAEDEVDIGEADAGATGDEGDTANDGATGDAGAVARSPKKSSKAIVIL